MSSDKTSTTTTTHQIDAWVQACLANPGVWNATEIYDWDKFYAQNPDQKISKVYDPPQRYGLDISVFTGKPGSDLSSPRFDEGDSAYFLSPQLTDEEIAGMTYKNKSAEMTGDLFEKLLGPAPDSSKVPEPFRNALFWMDGNHFAEELVSFNRWAWRSQSTEDNKNGRVVALGCMATDWTNDPTKYGAVGAQVPSFATLQQSPCKKYYQFGLVMVDNEMKVKFAKLTAMKIYIVQEGDKFVDRFGQPVSYITPGSLLRLNWGTDPYDCSPANLTLMYSPRKVAEYNEESGKIEKYSPNYEALMVKVATNPPEGLTSFEYMTKQERYDLVTSIVSDKQIYRSASTPPTGDVIENL